MNMRVVAAALLLGLGGCGDDANGDDGEDTTVDHRANVVGEYDATGSLVVVYAGQRQTAEASDSMSISAEPGSKTALRIHSEYITCDGGGVPATMTGENTFSVGEVTCVATEALGECDGQLFVKAGTGSRDASGTLQLTMRGDFVVTCLPLPIQGTFTLELTGTRTGQFLPVPQQ